MAELDLGAETDVAGQQAEQGRLRHRLQSANEGPNAGTEVGSALAQHVVQPKDVAVEEPVKVLWGRRDLVEAEELAYEAQVGAPGEFQPLKPVRRVELALKDPGKGLHPRAARVNQRAINVEQNQSYHAGKSQIFSNWFST